MALSTCPCSNYFNLVAIVVVYSMICKRRLGWAEILLTFSFSDIAVQCFNVELRSFRPISKRFPFSIFRWTASGSGSGH